MRPRTCIIGCQWSRERLLDEGDMRDLKNALGDRPEAGKLIPKAGGARKLRISLGGRGKRGGGRVIYWLQPAGDVLRIHLIAMYAKNEAEDLSETDKQEIAKTIKQMKGRGTT